MAESLTEHAPAPDADETDEFAGPSEPIGFAGRIEQGLLVGAMFVGSIGMWAGAPAFWLWLAGRSGKVSESAFGAFVMVIIGIPVTMVIIGKFLTRLDTRYTDRFGRHETRRISAARWLHSMRGGGEQVPPSMLDKVLVMSVALAFAAFGLWFVLFSHGSQAVRH